MTHKVQDGIYEKNWLGYITFRPAKHSPYFLLGTREVGHGSADWAKILGEK